MTPAISVLMSVHNGIRYLPRALSSVLEQDFGDFELVLVDDASTEDVRSIVVGCADPRVRMWRNEGNLGLTRSLNLGLSRCRGRYIARMDGDDVCLPGRLGRQYAFMESHPGVGLLGGQADCIDSGDAVVFQERHPVDERLLRWLLHFINPFWHPSVMMRADTLRLAGGYDESLACAQDYDLWVRMAALAPVAQLSEPVILYRIHPESVSSLRSGDQDDCALGIIRAGLDRLFGACPEDAVIKGAREILIRLPVIHASVKSVQLLRRSVAAFAASHGLSEAQLTTVQDRLSDDLECLARRHPEGSGWLESTPWLE